MADSIQFPNHYEVIREEAARFQELTARERIQTIQRMMEQGLRMTQRSPHREKILQMQEAEERAWRSAHAKVFAAYEAKHGKITS